MPDSDPIVTAACITLMGVVGAAIIAGIFSLTRRNNRPDNPGPFGTMASTLSRLERKANRQNLLLALILDRMGGAVPPDDE